MSSTEKQIKLKLKFSKQWSTKVKPTTSKSRLHSYHTPHLHSKDEPGKICSGMTSPTKNVEKP